MPLTQNSLHAYVTYAVSILIITHQHNDFDVSALWVCNSALATLTSNLLDLKMVLLGRNM
jgi:hypothetical protein